MHIDKIMIFKSRKSSLPLAEIIGVDIAGSAFNVDNVKSGTDANSLDQINGGDNRSAQFKFFLIGFYARGFAMSPEPDRVCRQMVLLLALHIDRVIMTHHLGMIHKVIQHISAVTTR